MKNKIALFFYSLIYLLISLFSIYKLTLLNIDLFKFEKFEDYISVLSLFSTHFVGSFFYLVGLYCAMKFPSSILIKKFFYLMIISGISISLSKASSLNIHLLKELEIISLSLAPYFLVMFFGIFPTKVNNPFFHKSVKLIISFVLFNIFIFLINLFTDSFYKLLSISIVINISISIAACVSLTYQHLKFNSDKVKNQLYIVILSFILSFSPVLLLSLIPGSLYRNSFVQFELTINAIILFPLALAYVLTKQEIIDFQFDFKAISIQIILVMVVLSIANGLLATNYDLSIAKFLLIDFVLFFLFVIYRTLEKLLKNPKKFKKIQQEIHKDKLLMQKQLLEGAHLITCAKLIVDIIHKIVKINGACVAQFTNNEWISLYKSGIFNKMDLSSIKFHFLNIDIHTPFFRIENNYILLPIIDNDIVLGCIIIGNKINQTRFTRNEMELLKEIKTDSTELFISNNSIQSIQNKISKESDYTYRLNLSLINALESEKKNLSTILHDDFLQRIILFSNKLEEETLAGNVNVVAYTKLYQMLDELTVTTRSICYNLHPVMVEDLGLQISLETLKKNTAQNHNILLDIVFDLDFKIISKNLSIQIYKIIRELVNNSIKHSKSEKIIVHLKDYEDIYIKIEDFGVGFEYNKINYFSKNSLGLITIQKRVKQLNGTFNIYSKINQGTSVIITIPNKRSEIYANTGIIS